MLRSNPFAFMEPDPTNVNGSRPWNAKGMGMRAPGE